MKRNPRSPVALEVLLAKSSLETPLKNQDTKDPIKDLNLAMTLSNHNRIDCQIQILINCTKHVLIM